MFFILFIYLFSFSIPDTETITIFRIKNDNKLFQIESNILKNIEFLYNRKNSKKIKFKYKNLQKFSTAFRYFDQEKTENKCFVATVSITTERLKKYDFSRPYLPAKEAMLALDEKGTKGLSRKRLAYVKGSIQEKRAKYLAKTEGMKLFQYTHLDEIVAALKKGDVDFILLENVSAWTDPQIKIVREFESEDNKGYGIVFAKGSALKGLLEPYLNYYLKSQAFYSLCRKLYGVEVTAYFKKHLLFEQAL